MKQLITNYTFNPTNRTIVFTDYTSLDLSGLLLITNISNSRKPVLYQFNDSGTTATVTGNVITLGYNTTSMNATDVLQIFYDDSNNDTTTTEEALLLRRVVKLLESSATVDIANRQKIAVEVMPTVATTISSGTVTTVSTVTTLNQIAGVDSRWQLIDWARMAYNSMRNNITFN